MERKIEHEMETMVIQGFQELSLRPFLEGHGDLVSGLIRGIVGVIIWLTEVIHLLTNFP